MNRAQAIVDIASALKAAHLVMNPRTHSALVQSVARDEAQRAINTATNALAFLVLDDKRLSDALSDNEKALLRSWTAEEQISQPGLK